MLLKMILSLFNLSLMGLTTVARCAQTNSTEVILFVLGTRRTDCCGKSSFDFEFEFLKVSKSLEFKVGILST
jgi:hypothetical protein